jgi:acyl-[acyl carrier protein]--UDP-N-acetylglucosamine O-acyltransferase
MSITNAFSKKFAEIRLQNPDRSAAFALLLMWGGVIRIVTAKYYLRKATQIGRLVSTFGKPLIRNNGKMVLGDEVRVWSNIVQAKLLTGRKGQLIVGKNSRLNGVHIYAGSLVEIGKNVRIAPYTIILDSDFHNVADHFGDGIAKPIVIEDDVWIATRATILKGVRIGKGAVVATGAVVTKNVAPYTMVAGVPAVFVKDIAIKEMK